MWRAHLLVMTKLIASLMVTEKYVKARPAKVIRNPVSWRSKQTLMKKGVKKKRRMKKRRRKKRRR